MLIYYHATVILSVILSGLFLVRWKKGISVYFPLIFLFIPIINLGYLKLATAHDLNEALLANGIGYLDGCYLQLIFFLCLTNHCKIKFPRVLMAVMLAMGSVIFFFAINGADNDLLYTSVQLKDYGGTAYLVKEYGPIHTMFYITLGLYFAANTTMLFYSFRKRNISKINSTLLLVTYTIIIVSFVGGKLIHPAFIMLPMAYCISQIVFLVVMNKFTLYDISESALANVAERGEIGFASFDLKLRYLGCTELAETSMPELRSLYIDQIIKPDNDTLVRIIGSISKLKRGGDAPFFYVTRDDVTYKVTAGFLSFGKVVKGYQLRIEDNTQEARNLEALRLRERQKEIEAKMLKLQKSAADSANKAKSSFLAEMSHEIRTPINAIIGMNEMILRTSREDETLEYSASIDTASKTLLSLINSILDFSKIEDGKMEIVPVKYKTSVLIHGLVGSIRERVKNKGLEFILDIDPELPSQLFGDDVRVAQVIQNLLTNAVKYTENGTVTLSVRDDGREEGYVFLDVAVKDTGIGIKQEDLPRLFQSFERLEEKRNRHIEGTGLGMSIVTKLLAMMDSELKVESEYGKGSVFSFRLRQEIADAAPVGSLAGGADAVRRSEPCGIYAPAARVLVVDDNDMNLKVADNLLGLFGIKPVLVSSGYETIEKMKKERYDIVFLDHMMPGMDGIETLRELRFRRLVTPETTVIALSANAIAGAREEYLKAGFDDYLSKPIEMQSLENCLDDYLPEDKKEKRPGAGEQAPAPEAPKEEQLIPGLPENITVSEGMRCCMDDVDFYKEMLAEYAASAEDKLSQLEDFRQKGDAANYRILVHSLKSSSRTVGAMDIGALAEELEGAAKNGDLGSINSGHGRLCEMCSAAAAGIRAALEQS